MFHFKAELLSINSSPAVQQCIVQHNSLYSVRMSRTSLRQKNLPWSSVRPGTAYWHSLSLIILVKSYYELEFLTKYM